MKEVVKRARRFNDAPGHLIKITELVVFGRYLDTTVNLTRRAYITTQDISILTDRSEVVFHPTDDPAVG